ncbi:MAG: hypothetical protein AAFX53_10040 [Bacteroidota bacterium]
MRLFFALLPLVLLVGKEPFPLAAETVFPLPGTVSERPEFVVFVAGFDEGKNRYYTQAKIYFEAQGFQVVHHLSSLEGIVQWLNGKAKRGKTFGEIHIVSHGNPWLGMSLKTTEQGERVSLETLSSEGIKEKIPQMTNGILTGTRIVFHSCGLAENTALIAQLKLFFTSLKIPLVYASPWFTVFGGKYAPKYLAKPYYGFYPTAESPGPLALSKEFAQKYPQTDIDWFSAIRTRMEKGFGEAYSYKFNIPVSWEFSFAKTTEIPLFRDTEALMDWLVANEAAAKSLFQLGIPIEKYRWRSRVKGNTLYIQGKTTVLCVLKPIMGKNKALEYRSPSLDDDELYQIL